MDRKNGDTPDEDDRKLPCPYCQKRLKHVNKHKSNCPKKPQDRPECPEEDVPTLQGNQEYKYELSLNLIVLQESKKDRKNSDTSDEDDGKQPRPYCQKRLKHVNKHKSNCPKKPQDRPECTEEDVPTLQGNQEYASSNSIVSQESKKDRKNSDTSDEDDGKQPCPYCQKRLKNVNKHKSNCPKKPQDRPECTEEDVPTLQGNQEYASSNSIVHQESKKDRKNSDTSDEDDGKQPCPYCQKRLKHVNIHKTRCPSKPQERPGCKTTAKGLSLSDNEEYDAKLPCPYCQKRLKHVYIHTFKCPSKPQDGLGHKTTAKGLSLSDNEDDDGKLPCPYCQKRLKHVYIHTFRCPSKPQDGPGCKTAAKGRSLSDDKDDGKLPCPYCQKRLKHVYIHKSKCPSKPQDKLGCKIEAKELPLSDKKVDDGKLPCQYCFQDLNMHQSKCPLKLQDEEDFGTAEKGLNSSDDEDDLKLSCPYCQKMLFSFI